MTDTVFKAPKSRKGVKSETTQNLPPFPKRKRTAEDFYMFCNLILEYENYEPEKPNIREKESGSPVDSGGSGVDSYSSESNSSSSASSQDDNKHQDTESDDDSWDLVTCFCMKPFAGRPMIECSNCLTWIHLSCAKIKRTNIPEEYICQRCKESKLTSRRSQRAKLEDSPTS